MTKWARKNSFFNFFNPPKLRDVDEVHHLRRRELLEAHYEIGLFFKEQLIPKAYLFFMRSGYDGNGIKSLRDKRLKMRSSSKANTPAIPRIPKRKNSDDIGTEKKQKTFTVKQESSVVTSTKTDKNENSMERIKSGGIEQKQDSNENIVEVDEYQKRLQNQVLAVEDKTEILESISLPEEKDPFPGRYLMESSDKFDEFMKALGVGMIKRKLANSIIPINEMEIADDGTYTLRTISTVRTTEINFKLDQKFLEDTIDGRKTETTPTRNGNLLVLDQRGQKGDKDSKMTRELEGDVMIMKLFVDDVICTRIYKRILEE